MATVSNQHLYPFTLAFAKALQEGTVDLDTAGIFVDRVYEAWLEARVQANPELKKDPAIALALKAETE